ncbi:hypothetical protein [Spiroplasma tabanidicola]|uniref:Lipoprotein n=1 Tax=Spiroplasma tabanidicola TaxID=324079 RepID=A0A6I6C616_9MOLU|nr:hypothetical protein [Spiroplasma tabanidicola]QGS51590.1 hypothetical protein STABA_v1c02230 [Spiroplasma tabanidicola]
MKRLLSAIATFGVLISSSTSAISCSFKSGHNNEYKNTDGNKGDGGLDYGKDKPEVPSEEDDPEPGTGGIDESADPSKYTDTLFQLDKNRSYIYTSDKNDVTIANITNYDEIAKYSNSLPNLISFVNSEDSKLVSIRVDKDKIIAKIKDITNPVLTTIKSIKPIQIQIKSKNDGKQQVDFTLNIQTDHLDLANLQNNVKVNYFLTDDDSNGMPKSLGYTSSYLENLSNSSNSDHEKAKKDFFDKFINDSGININLSDVTITQSNSGENGKDIEFNIKGRNKPDSKIVPDSNIKLIINKDVDPNEVFKNKSLEVNVFSGTFQSIKSRGMTDGDKQGIKALVFEELIANSGIADYLKKLSDDNYARSTTQVLKNSTINLNTKTLSGSMDLNLAYLGLVFKGNLKVNYHLVEESRANLYSEVTKNDAYKKYDVNREFLTDQTSENILKAKLQLYNQLSQDFRQQVDQNEFVKYTKFTESAKETSFTRSLSSYWQVKYWAGFSEFGVAMRYKLIVLPGSKKLYGHYPKTFWNYINTADPDKPTGGPYHVIVDAIVPNVPNADAWKKEGGASGGSDFTGYEGGFDKEFTEGLGWWSKSKHNQVETPNRDGYVQNGEYNEGYDILKF